jgi:hypothetical protein
VPTLHTSTPAAISHFLAIRSPSIPKNGAVAKYPSMNAVVAKPAWVLSRWSSACTGCSTAGSTWRST